MTSEWKESKLRNEKMIGMVRDMNTTWVTRDNLETYQRTLPADSLKAQIFTAYDNQGREWAFRMSEISPRDREELR